MKILKESISDHDYFQPVNELPKHLIQTPINLENSDNDITEPSSPTEQSQSNPSSASLICSSVSSTPENMDVPMIEVESFDHNIHMKEVHHKMDLESKDKKINALELKVKHLETRIDNRIEYEKQLKAEIIKNQKEISKLRPLTKIFKPDQVTCLEKGNLRGYQWTNDTIMDSLETYFTCHTSGYNHLRSKGFPLPSLRTIQRRVANIDFRPGILTEVFEMLKPKVKSMPENERVCSLTIDAMSIKPSTQYDKSSHSFVGESTFPGHSGTATKAIVFMIGGVIKRWKETVCYHFTTDLGIDENECGALVSEIIINAENIGLHVKSVCTDMDGSNQKL